MFRTILMRLTGIGVTENKVVPVPDYNLFSIIYFAQAICPVIHLAAALKITLNSMQKTQGNKSDNWQRLGFPYKSLVIIHAEVFYIFLTQTASILVVEICKIATLYIMCPCADFSYQCLFKKCNTANRIYINICYMLVCIQIN